MEHYFRVNKMPGHLVQKRKPNFIFQWLSNLKVTGWLILVNVVFFFVSFMLGFDLSQPCSQTLCKYIAIQSDSFINQGYIWTLLTSMFMHANIWHLLFNMFTLFFIGRFLEMIIGKKRFFGIYLLSGIFAGLFFVLFVWLFGDTEMGGKLFGTILTPAVGASGAIFGLAGVLAFITPKSRVYLLLGPLLAIIFSSIFSSFIKSDMLASLLSFLIMIYLIFSLSAVFSFNAFFKKLALAIEMPFWMIPFVAIFPLMIVDLFLPSGISTHMGNMAHLGGFIAGAGYGLYLRLKYKKKVQIISQYFSR